MDDLARLSEAVTILASQASVRETIGRLKRELPTSSEPFVWSSLDLAPIEHLLPAHIKSAWIFVLKKEAWSGAHMHPNSVQHMVVLEGRGRSRIGSSTGELQPPRLADPSTAQWCVIEAGIEHEFYPLEEDMVVISFHTCAPGDLIEVSASGGMRHYEPPGKPAHPPL